MNKLYETTKFLYSRILVVFKYSIFVLGTVFLIMLVLSFTSQPFWAYHWLGTSKGEFDKSPHYIVVMGAGGMPSPEGLMRCYYAAKAAKEYSEAKVIIAMPTLSEFFWISHPYRMYKEIQLKGIDSTRFIFEIHGTNTRTQALEISKILPRNDTTKIVVITSPEHMMRAVLAFKKLGFPEVGGIPTFEDVLDEDLLLDQDERRLRTKSLEHNVTLRYNMWNYLKYEILVIRESIAISYYWLRGWV
jgi:uncharacterized SAM-binding protein YcdF (DUF218 family)